MRASSTGNGVRQTEVENIIAVEETDPLAPKKYNGKRSTWPGAVALVVLVLGAAAAMTYFALQLRKGVKHYQEAESLNSQENYGSGTFITDGTKETANLALSDTNPKTYSSRGCTQPNYLSQDGYIVADYGGGSTTKMAIKGINWNGMENSNRVPSGLWDGDDDGNSLFRFSSFFQRNNFNAVRLPLAIDSVLRNLTPKRSMINSNSNRALYKLSTSYIGLISGMVQGLGRQNLGIVLDFHYLTENGTDDETGLWYGDSIELEDIETAITNLADELCDSTHWNIIGIDLKDSLTKATWGDGSKTDWADAATTLGNHMLDKCSNWLAFVQGISSTQRKTFDDRTIKFTDWDGAGFEDAVDSPISLDTDDKVVYSPQFYSPSELPQLYMFDDGTSNGYYIEDYVESDNATLKSNIDLAMDYMFGGVLNETAYAVMLSQFGGLTLADDAYEDKTSTRVIEYLIDKMLASTAPLAGGFWYAMNPTTYWSFYLADNATSVSNGLVTDTYRSADFTVLNVLKAMDSMENLNFLQCK